MTWPSTGDRLTFFDTWQPLASSGIDPKRPVLTVFYRGHWCDYCNEQLAELAGSTSAFARMSIQVLAITTDDREGLETMIERVGNAFPILGDSDGELIRGLSLVDPFEFRPVPVSLPAVFLSDASGVVRFHYVGRSPDDRPRLELLLLAAERLSMETC